MPNACTRTVLAAALAGAVAVSLAAGLATPLAAETPPEKQKHKQARKYDPNTADRYEPPSPRPPTYIERDASKLRFGSSEWWEQMQREGRLGGERP